MGSNDADDVIERTYRGDAEGEAYHGPALRTMLRDVTCEKAAARPIAGAHTIWEIVLHVVAWREWALAGLDGRKAHVEADGWTTVSVTPAAWAETLRRLDASQTSLVAAVRVLPEPRTARQDEILRFVLHHDLHHGGQIGLLRRA